MRISKVTYFTNVKNNISREKQKDNLNKLEYSEKKYSEYKFPNYITFGKEKPFVQTLKENYFKLPQGCYPDNFQIEAGKAINDGRDVIVEAPTGTGKTAIAHYAVARNMQNGKTTFYTTPLKALSNQKLDEFRKVYGEENVGILTGDRRENTQAPIIIMTTEVYRNMALSNMYGEKNPMMENLGTVISDEFHYMGDIDRGSVWEEALMYTPKGVQTLALSATIGNSAAIKNWMKSIDGNNAVLVSVPSEERNVPLNFYMLGTGSYIAEEKRVSNSLQKKGYYAQRDDYRYTKPVLSDFKHAVDKLKQEERLPAIFFVFSKRFSRELTDYFAKDGKDLTTAEEKQEIKQIVKEYKSKKYIGSDLNMCALEKGYAIHNAGIIPNQKKLVEELFQKKLLKVVIATETLAAGINMPAKTVVISSPFKPTDENKDSNIEEELSVRLLTPNEFKQMAGRAGRRGIDKEGFVYTMPTDKKTEQDFLMMEFLPNNPIESRYKPDYAFLTGFYEHNTNSNKLKDIYNRTFYSFNENPALKDEKTKQLCELSNKMTGILRERGYIKEENGNIRLTSKGYMASKVRGYDTLTLVDATEKGVFEGITPEVLASIAGALANPAKGHESEINVKNDMDDIIRPINENIDRIYHSLKSQIIAKLKKLDMDFDKFETYDDIIRAVESIQKPEKSENELDERLRAEEEKREKMYIITADSGSYTLQTVADSIKNGKSIPTKVLEKYSDIVEQYKSRIHKKDIDSYIEKLETEYKSTDISGKGNKAKARLERKKEEVEEKICKAKLMKYLDENIENCLAENQRFLKKNPPSIVKEEYRQAELEYNRMALKDGLISQVEAVKSIEDYIWKSEINKEREANKNKAEHCMEEIMKISEEVHDCENRNGINESVDRLGKNAAKGMYFWAALNKINTGSMSNWREMQNIIFGKDIDEGTIYRMTMQTADLLSQIVEIANAGANSCEDSDKEEYYNDLKRTAKEARRLIIKEPVEI